MIFFLGFAAYILCSVVCVCVCVLSKTQIQQSLALSCISTLYIPFLSFFSCVEKKKIHAAEKLQVIFYFEKKMQLCGPREKLKNQQMRSHVILSIRCVYRFGSTSFLLYFMPVSRLFDLHFIWQKILSIRRVKLSALPIVSLYSNIMSFWNPFNSLMYVFHGYLIFLFEIMLFLSSIPRVIGTKSAHTVKRNSMLCANNEKVKRMWIKRESEEEKSLSNWESFFTCYNSLFCLISG